MFFLCSRSLTLVSGSFWEAREGKKLFFLIAYLRFVNFDSHALESVFRSTASFSRTHFASDPLLRLLNSRYRKAKQLRKSFHQTLLSVNTPREKKVSFRQKLRIVSRRGEAPTSHRGAYRGRIVAKLNTDRCFGLDPRQCAL